jgi:anti-anti-sigma factor
MEIRVSNQQGRVPVTVFHIVGDVDTNTYQQLQAQAEQAHAAGASNIVLDLSQAGYVSSAGIRAINHIYTLLRTNAPAESDEAVRQGIKAGTFRSPHLKLARLNKRVSEALTNAGVDMFLEFHPDLAAAVASFS